MNHYKITQGIHLHLPPPSLWSLWIAWPALHANVHSETYNGGTQRWRRWHHPGTQWGYDGETRDRNGWGKWYHMIWVDMKRDQMIWKDNRDLTNHTMVKSKIHLWLLRDFINNEGLKPTRMGIPSSTGVWDLTPPPVILLAESPLGGLSFYETKDKLCRVD